MLNYTLANANVKAFKNFCQEERSHIDQVIFERIAESQGMRNCTDIMFTLTSLMAHVMGGFGDYLFGLAFLGHIRRDAVDIRMGLDKREFEQRMR